MKVREKVAPIKVGAVGYKYGFFDEQKDCTVRALANAADVNYIAAHATLAKYGRTSGRGCTFDVFSKAYSEYGFELDGVYGTTISATQISHYTGVKAKKGITLARILPTLTGRHIVLIRGHAFAVVNGEVIDTGGLEGAGSVAAVFTLKEEQ